MRFTNQMMARTAVRAGMQFPQNSLLNSTNRKSSAGSLFTSSINKARGTKGANAYLSARNRQNSAQLKSSAESLSDYASKLSESLADAKETNQKTEAVSDITNMADAYNKTLQYLKSSDSILDQYYYQELKNSVSGNSAALRAVGIGVGKDGKLQIQKGALSAAGTDSLEKAFSPAFVDRISYVGAKVAENATSSAASILGGYNKYGTQWWNSLQNQGFQFWG